MPRPPRTPATHHPPPPRLPAFLPHPPARLPRPRRHRPPVACAPSPTPGQPATGPNARRLARWLAADWANPTQAQENPTFWAHIHVCFRPLPWHLLGGYALYCESAYDYNLGAPYKTSVVLVVHAPDGALELASYKLADPDEFWLGAHEPELLEPLTAAHLARMPDACNTVYVWDRSRDAYVAYSRPGKACRIRRGGKEKETYLESRIMLTKDQYAAWDLGKDPETDDVVWGTKAGPFVFDPMSRLDHLVPDEPAIVTS